MKTIFYQPLMARKADTVRKVITWGTLIVLGMMTLTWLVKAGMGIRDNDFLYYLFGWPYTITTLSVVGLEVDAFLRATPNGTPPRPKEHGINKIIKLVTLWVPILFACGFVFSIRMWYDYQHGWWSRIMKNLLVMVGLLAPCVYRTFTTYHYLKNDTTYHIPGMRQLNWLMQLATFYGMVDAVSYSIFAGDKFTSYGDLFHTDDQTIYTIFMLSTVLNGMGWFRISHEFYALFNNHECDISIRHKDYGYHTHHLVTWGIFFLLWTGIVTTEITLESSKMTVEYLWLDTPVTSLCILVCVITGINWLRLTACLI